MPEDVALVRTERVDNSDSEEFEEVYVFLEFNGAVELADLKSAQGRLQVCGIETSAPLIRLNKWEFQASARDEVGTTLFLEEAPNSESSIRDPLFEEVPTTSSLRYVSKSNKTLAARNVAIVPRTDPPDAERSQGKEVEHLATIQ